MWLYFYILALAVRRIHSNVGLWEENDFYAKGHRKCRSFWSVPSTSASWQTPQHFTITVTSASERVLAPLNVTRLRNEDKNGLETSTFIHFSKRNTVFGTELEAFSTQNLKFKSTWPSDSEFSLATESQLLHHFFIPGHCVLIQTIEFKNLKLNLEMESNLQYNLMPVLLDSASFFHSPKYSMLIHCRVAVKISENTKCLNSKFIAL